MNGKNAERPLRDFLVVTGVRRWRVGNFVFDADSRMIQREGGRQIRLSIAEHSLLLRLCEMGSVTASAEDRRLDNQIYRLRQRLGMSAQIICIRGYGYKLLNAEAILPENIGKAGTRIWTPPVGSERAG